MPALTRAIATSALLIAPAASATPPCGYPFEEMGAIVSPGPDAVDVPTNAAPLINLRLASQPPTLSVETSGLEVTATTLNYVDGFGTEQLVLLRPAAPLPSGAIVTMTFDGEDAPSQTFTTGDGPDTDAPAAPNLGDFSEYSDGACEPFVAIEIAGDGSEAYFIASLDAEPTIDDGAEINGITRGQQDRTIVVGGPADATANVFVAGVDLAGNVGPAASIEVTFPPQAGNNGCGHNGPSQMDGPRPRAAALLILLGLALKRRSRRGR